MFWNEGSTVKRYKALKEGRGSVVSVSPQTYNSENDGRLVHVSGVTKSATKIKDDRFGIAYDGLMLSRNVEMYQWQESTEQRKKTTVGGTEKTVTVYNYKKVWQSFVIDSSGFKRSEKYRNPTDMRVKNKKFTAGNVKLGAFTLSENQVKRVGGWNQVSVKDSDIRGMKNVTVSDDMVFVGTGIISFVLTVALSLLIVSIAWLFYRPLVAVPLLCISVGLIVFLKLKARNNQ